MGYIMWVGTKRFDAKTIDRIAKNFLRWRNKTVLGINTIGTHWPVKCSGEVCGELMYDGAFWPAEAPGRRPCEVVEDVLAQRFGATNAHSPEYRAGVRVALEWTLMRSPMGCPYSSGSVEADAFASGLNEGRKLSVGLQHPSTAPALVMTAARGGRRNDVTT